MRAVTHEMQADRDEMKDKSEMSDMRSEMKDKRQDKTR